MIEIFVAIWILVILNFLFPEDTTEDDEWIFYLDLVNKNKDGDLDE